jgi:hypothetical protein
VPFIPEAIVPPISEVIVPLTVLGFKPKFSNVHSIYKEINKAHLIVGIGMRIQAIHLPLISGFFLDRFNK